MMLGNLSDDLTSAEVGTIVTICTKIYWIYILMQNTLSKHFEKENVVVLLN
jgi:hypothetical protein